MFKKSVLMTLALGLVLSLSAVAQESQQFTVTSPGGKVEVLKAFKNDLPNVADLSQAELESLLANNQCGDTVKSPTACAGWTGRFCTGARLVIPCGFFANGAWKSVQFGCLRTLVATGANLTGTVTQFTGFPQDICITPTANITYGSFACGN